MPATKTWKSAERRVATMLGGERIPVSGRARGSAPDVKHDWLSIEVKSWRAFPDWIKDALAQAVASVRGNQLPIAILHEKGKRYDNALVVMKLADFCEFFGEVEVPSEGKEE